MSATSDWKSHLFPLMAGQNALDLWPLTNLMLPAYFLLIFFPRWKYTHQVALISPAIHGVMYLVGLISILTTTSSDGGSEFSTDAFSSLEGIYELFRDPNALFIGWIHYLAFDLLVARGISLDALELGISPLLYLAVIGPIIVATLMAGPVGYVLYLSFRAVVLAPGTKKRGE